MFGISWKTGVGTLPGLVASLLTATCVFAADESDHSGSTRDWYDLPDVALRYIPTDMSEDYLQPAYTLGEQKVQVGFRIVPSSMQYMEMPNVAHAQNFSQAERDYSAYKATLSTVELQIEADSSNRKRFRKKLAGWFGDKMSLPEPVTRLFSSSTSSGFHLDVDPGDEYVLEWEREF